MGNSQQINYINIGLVPLWELEHINSFDPSSTDVQQWLTIMVFNCKQILLIDFGGLDSPVIPGVIQPVYRDRDMFIEDICGKYKGIQGHHNSCYLDATLFSMFMFTR